MGANVHERMNFRDIILHLDDKVWDKVRDEVTQRV